MSATPPGSFPGYGASAANDEDPSPEAASGTQPAATPAPAAESYFQPAAPDPAQPPAGYPPPPYPGNEQPTYQAPQQYQPPQQYQQQPPQQFQPPQEYQQQPPQQYQPPQGYPPPQQYQAPQDYQGQQQYQPAAYQPAAESPAPPAPPAPPAGYETPSGYQQPESAPSSAPPYQPTGANPYDPQPAGQYPGQARHSTQPVDNAPPYAQMYGSNPSAPGQQPYGGVPGMVLPPNYAVYMSPTHRAVGVVGLVISLIGAALVVISFTALDWLSGDDGFGGTDKVTFRNLHDLVGSDAPAVPRLYFNWLGYALLAVVLILAVLGNLPTGTHALWRILGILGGFAGVIITFYSLYNGGTTLSDIYKYGSAGFWLAMAGFFVMGIGAVIGPRRVRG